MSNAGPNSRGALKPPPADLMQDFDNLPGWARAAAANAPIDLNPTPIRRDIDSGRLDVLRLRHIIERQARRLQSEAFPGL